MGSIVFDTNDYLSLAITPGTKAATMTAWIQSDNITGSPTNHAFSLQVSGTDWLSYGMNGSTNTTIGQHNNSATSAAGPSLTNTSTWYFIALCWNTASNGGVRLRWRAEADETLTSPADSLGSFFTVSWTTLYVGRGQYYGTATNWNGRITQVKYWSTLLSDSEILTESNQQFPAQTTNIEGYWPLDTSGDFTFDTYGSNLTETGTTGFNSSEPNIPYTPGGGGYPVINNIYRNIIGGGN